MTFTAQETSVEAGSPVELYTFEFGLDIKRRTNNSIDVVHNGLTYTSTVMTRTALIEEKNKKGEKLEINLPATDPLVRTFLGKPPGVTAEVTLQQTHRTDGAEELITQFNGEIQTVDFTDNGHAATMQVLALTSALTRNIPRITYQGICNHFLYDKRCKVLEGDPNFQKTLTVIAVTSLDRVLTASGAGAFGADFFTGGFVESADGDFRAIIKQSGDDLTLMTSFNRSPLNDSLKFNAGCDGTAATCVSKFDNILNHGSYGLFIATKDLFRTGI